MLDIIHLIIQISSKVEKIIVTLLKLSTTLNISKNGIYEQINLSFQVPKNEQKLQSTAKLCSPNKAFRGLSFHIYSPALSQIAVAVVTSQSHCSFDPLNKLRFLRIELKIETI